MVYCIFGTCPTASDILSHICENSQVLSGEVHKRGCSRENSLCCKIPQRARLSHWFYAPAPSTCMTPCRHQRQGKEGAFYLLQRNHSAGDTVPHGVKCHWSDELAGWRHVWAIILWQRHRVDLLLCPVWAPTGTCIPGAKIRAFQRRQSDRFFKVPIPLSEWIQDGEEV